MRSFFMIIAVMTSLGVNAGAIDTNGITVLEQELTNRANSFGLKVEDIKKYDSIMKGPRGVFYQRGDKNIYFVLGAEAESEQERRKYAEMYMDESYKYHANLSQWIKTVDSVGKERFGINPRIMDIHSSKGSLQLNNDKPLFRRLKLYIKIDDCSYCVNAVKAELVNVDKGVIGGLDLYFVDANRDDERIRRWARSIRLDPNLVASQKVTLNHDDLQSPSKEYPARKGIL